MFTFTNRILFCEFFNKNIKYFFAKQKHTERIINVIVKNVNEQSNIFIKSNFNLKIKPFDLLDCPAANILRATLIDCSGTTNDSGIDHHQHQPNGIKQNVPNINIEVNEKEININDTKIEDSTSNEQVNQQKDITCLLEVPVNSNLEISSNGDIDISNMYSDYLKLETLGNIITRDIRGTTFNIMSNFGDISCYGLTLAHKIDLRVKRNGNIHLDKVQGDLMHAICDNGRITTNSCYVEASKFVTLNGGLRLKNVHKYTEVYLLEGGALEMTGFHGRLQSKTNGGELYFQLTEIYGDSCIMANDPERITVNISEFIEENTKIEMVADKITLDDSIDHLKDNLLDKCVFRVDNNKTVNAVNDENFIEVDKLTVNAGGLLKIGKKSWMDTIKAKLEEK